MYLQKQMDHKDEEIDRLNEIIKDQQTSIESLKSKLSAHEQDGKTFVQKNMALTQKALNGEMPHTFALIDLCLEKLQLNMKTQPQSDIADKTHNHFTLINYTIKLLKKHVKKESIGTSDDPQLKDQVLREISGYFDKCKECYICHLELDENEPLQPLKDCGHHQFHKKCI